MLRKLRRVSELSPGELLVFWQLVLFALITRVALAVLALPRISAFIAYAANKSLWRCLPLFHHFHGIARLTRLADLAARGTRADGPCLIRSLLLFWLLKTRGENAELLIGVRKDGPVFNSHAWIESDGKILGENEHGPLQFATLLRF
jgi:hypothetical protein